MTAFASMSYQPLTAATWPDFVLKTKRPSRN